MTSDAADLGLDALTDHELEVLGRAVLAEVATRGGPLAARMQRRTLETYAQLAVARDAPLIAEAQMRLDLAAEIRAQSLAATATEREYLREKISEVERSRADAAEAKRLAALRRRALGPVVSAAQLITLVLGEGWTAKRWRSDFDRQDERLYLTGPDYVRRQGRYGRNDYGSWVEYCITGSRDGRHAAQRLKLSGVSVPRVRVRALVEHLSAQGVPTIGTPLDCNECLEHAHEFNIEPAPLPSWAV